MGPSVLSSERHAPKTARAMRGSERNSVSLSSSSRSRRRSYFACHARPGGDRARERQALAGAVVAHHQGAHAAPTRSNDQHCLCGASICARLSQGSLASTTPTDHEARFATAEQTLAVHHEALPSRKDLYSQPWACDLTACRQYSFVNCSSTWTLNHSPPPEAMPVGAQSGSAHRLRTRASIFW